MAVASLAIGVRAVIKVDIYPGSRRVTGDTLAGIVGGRRQVAGQALARCAGIATFQMAANALDLGMGARQWIEAVVKIIADEKNGLGFDPFLGGGVGIGDVDKLLRRCGSQ